MARNCFSLPSVVRLPIGEDHWIEVKEQLNYGEQQTLASSSLTTMTYNAERAQDGDTEIGLDMKRAAILRLMLYIDAWSFTDFSGKQLPVSRSNIENLTPEIAAEVNEALDTHVKAIEGKVETRIIEAGFVAN